MSMNGLENFILILKFDSDTTEKSIITFFKYD